MDQCHQNSNNNQQNTSVDEEGRVTWRATEFHSSMSLQWPVFALSTCNSLVPPTEVSVRDNFLAATAFSRYRSALEPMTCPSTDAAMVKAMADLGISTDFRSMAMNGTAACTAANQDGENFLVCSLHTPKGTLAAMPNAPITSTFSGRGCGRRFFANAVRARAARAATIAGGHLIFMPGGGWKTFATSGITPLTARYDFAIGQLPDCSHSLLKASWLEFPPWNINSKYNKHREKKKKKNLSNDMK